jgi:hypothetical protein
MADAILDRIVHNAHCIDLKGGAKKKKERLNQQKMTTINHF